MNPTNPFNPTPEAVDTTASDQLSCRDRAAAVARFREWQPKIENAGRADLEALAVLLLQRLAVDGSNPDREWSVTAHTYFDHAAAAVWEKISTKTE